jgi:hypothetical protein
MTMKFLFDSKGRHIANFVNGQLHAPAGRNIGHYVANHMIFIDMHGHYLGEIAHDNRLLYKRQSPHKNTNFGIYGNHGNVGNFGNPGRYGVIGIPGGFQDVHADWLAPVNR